MGKLAFVAIILVGGILGGILFSNLLLTYFPVSSQVTQPLPLPPPKPTPTPVVRINQPADSYLLSEIPFVYQTFNNCGPAALSMALSYYGISTSQQELADILRPYQNPSGDNDDKSVTFPEFGQVLQKYNLRSYYRPNGDIQKIKLLLTNGFPVITRTWYRTDDYIGHFRIIEGFDDKTQEFTQVDSIEGQRRFSYQGYLKLWRPFNYEYLIIFPLEKEKVVRKILGEEVDEKVAWDNAVNRAQEELTQRPNNPYSLFNLSTAYYHLGKYSESIKYYEQTKNTISIKMLWYQIEPILSYQKLKNYDRVFTLTQQIFNTQNKGFSELYIIRGDIYLEQGKKEEAKAEYEKAYLYNKNLPQAKQKLSELSKLGTLE